MVEQEDTNTIEQQTGIYYAPWEKSADRIITPFERFVHRQTSSSFVLMVATLLALILANSAFFSAYDEFTHIKLAFSLGPIFLEKTLHHWVNDGLMALFFFVIGLELKREILVGELANFRKAALPIVAAVGGMAVPALIYFAFNPDGLGQKGWAIPMATDIAFAIGILVLLGNRIPRSLMAFLVALAIADDLGAVIVIAVFYTETINNIALGAAVFFTAVLVIFNVSGIRSPIPYFVIAVCLWLAMLYSGVHATLAGVIGAFTVPARPKYDPVYFKKRVETLMQNFAVCQNANPDITVNVTMRSIVNELEDLLKSVTTPMSRLEHIWHVPVAFIVVPVFAFFNAGVPISLQELSKTEHSSVLLGVIFGLVLGKFLGIASFCYLAIKFNLAQLPNNTSFGQICGAALLAGIGFTMSIFIAQLSFYSQPEVLTIAKTGILAGSLISGISGYFWLRYLGKDNRYERSSVPVC